MGSLFILCAIFVYSNPLFGFGYINDVLLSTAISFFVLEGIDAITYYTGKLNDLSLRR
ncbi:hypothetical protein Asfd1_174 [Aeromonas phage Asfd_1]|nr:hypothetical protein Asfd1_174 [Aeromonas phage Asfd_1]